jgi:membrane associated rhomboid family serine protease
VGGMRMWSANTWIIVLCVAVFVVDEFLPQRYVYVTTRFKEDAAQVDRASIREGSQLELLEIRSPQTGASRFESVRPLHVGAPDGPVVGWNIYRPMKFLQSFLHFSTAKGMIWRTPQGSVSGFEFWRLVGFQFLHAGLGHLLFNMIGLFFFGPMVERYLGSKRYVAFYLLCGIFGALMYMLLNLGGVAMTMFGGSGRIPGLLFNSPTTPLIGASAGVFGVLMAGAFLAPNVTVLVMFIIPMRLRTMAYLLVGFAVYTVLFRGQNAGGEAAHLGGAAAGFYFIRHPRHLHGFFDFLGWVDPTSHHYGRKGKGRRSGGQRGGAAPDQDQIDRILDKISTKGLHSLSAKEKRLLRESSRRP